jgi:hypothetical protein
MNEEQVKKYLGFLNEKYHMNYIYNVFDNYLGTNAILQTFTFYNNYGCFVIHDVPVKGEVEYVCLDDIKMLNKYGNKPSSVKKQVIDVSSVKKEIWERYQKIGPFKNPFFWTNNNSVLKVLAKVIEKQIQETGKFYGIKVDEY